MELHQACSSRSWAINVIQELINKIRSTDLCIVSRKCQRSTLNPTRLAYSPDTPRAPLQALKMMLSTQCKQPEPTASEPSPPSGRKSCTWPRRTSSRRRSPSAPATGAGARSWRLSRTSMRRTADYNTLIAKFSVSRRGRSSSSSPPAGPSVALSGSPASMASPPGSRLENRHT